MPVTPLPVLHARASAFSYQCRACNRCCYNRRIQVNPYEIARLSRNLGHSTSDVIANYTVDGGTALATRDSACVFLGPDGCTVHADRPLVCRLFPLGRFVQADGSEVFVELAPHPETEGLYGEDGTVDAYLESQGVAPYLTAADRYYAVLTRLCRPTEEPPVGSLGETSAEGIDARVFIDADLAVEMHAARGGAAATLDAESLVERHIALIERWADELQQRR